MELVPSSILGRNTTALDATFAERLENLGIGQLLIDLENERDTVKLTLYLHQFGIPLEMLPADMTDFQFRRLLQGILRIYRLSGTPASIIALGEALGASSVEIVRNAFVLDHASQARHDGLHHYDQGREHRAFSIDVTVAGVTVDQRGYFETTFGRLYKLFQPAGLHLRALVYV